MEIIQQIGSYAGFAAVVGLAVLAGLYFSQARDVKRLREWAGRAPERVATSYQPPPRVVAQPARQGPPPRPPVPPPPAPGAQPAAAQPAAAGAGPAVATGPLAATPAAARAAEGSADALTQNTVAHPPPRPPPQTLAPRATPPGLGGHFAREAQIAAAREEAQRVDGQPGDAAEQLDPEHGEEGGGEPLEAEPLEAELLEAEPLEAEPLEGGDAEEGRPEAAEAGLEEHQDEGEEVGHEDVELDDAEAGHAAELDDDAEYDERSDSAVDDLPDPEDFHEGHELVDEPEPSGVGDQRTVAPPVRPPPPPITASRQQPLPPRPPPPPRSAQAPILPPYETSRPGGGRWENRSMSTPKAALAVGATVAVVAAAAFGGVQLTGGDDGAKQAGKSTEPASTKPAGTKKRPAKAAIDPGSVTVSVLNGTTVGGLAAQLGDRLQGQGFQLGNVTNNTDQQRAESVVLFAPGAEDEAKDVGRRLKIDQREPIDPDSQTRAGDATVVVVTGADLNK